MNKKNLTVKWEGQPQEAERVDFKTSREDWNIYDLSDGSRLKMRTVVTDIVRLLKIHKSDGEPIYLVKSANIVEAEVEDHMKVRIKGSKEVN